MDDALTAAQTADLLNVPYSTLLFWRSLEPPVGPAHRTVRGRYMFARADVLAWLAIFGSALQAVQQFAG